MQAGIAKLVMVVQLVSSQLMQNIQPLVILNAPVFGGVKNPEDVSPGVGLRGCVGRGLLLLTGVRTAG